MRIYDCFGCGEKKKEFLKTTGPERKSVPPEPGIRAFSSKVESGSREENASKAEDQSPVLIQIKTEMALAMFRRQQAVDLGFAPFFIAGNTNAPSIMASLRAA
jgi:hypothetical protein